jgi:hypothetical protein
MDSFRQSTLRADYYAAEKQRACAIIASQHQTTARVGGAVDFKGIAPRVHSHNLTGRDLNYALALEISMPD